MKGARRYRYYVSRKLIQGKADQAHRGWRLPAAEIEGIVAVAARQMLDDEKPILDAVQNAEIASNQIPEIMQSASVWSRRLESATECSSALTVLVDRVELSPDGFRLALKLPTQVAPQPWTAANRAGDCCLALRPDADQTAGCRTATRNAMAIGTRRGRRTRPY